MAYKVTDACVNCGACEPECPVEAISEKNGLRWIDPAKCTNCGTCIPGCKPGVIFQHRDLDHVIICDNCFKCTNLCNTGAITMFIQPAKESS